VIASAREYSESHTTHGDILLESSYRNKTHGDSLNEYTKAHRTHDDSPFENVLIAIKPTVIASVNTPKLTELTVIALLESFYHNKTHGVKGSYSNKTQ
jgi:hypothetical protein